MTSLETAPSVERPAVQPPGAWEFPLPRSTAYDNGLTLHSYHVPGQYVVSLRLIVPLSVRAEARDKEGVAMLLTRLLDEGTERYGTDEFTELLERTGIAFGAGLSDGGMHVDMDVPHDRLADALHLLHSAIAEPAFPDREVRRIVRTRLAEIEQERASAAHRAARELAATYFHPEERASRPTGGSAATVAGLTRQDFADFHATHIGPTHATLVIAGDLSEVDTETLVGDALRDWQAVPVPARPASTPARRADDAARIVLVDRPGSVQSELTVAWDGPDRHVTPSWAAYQVLGFVVGGSPNARVDAVLREEKGYTYGIRSSFRPRRAGGIFATTGSVRTEVTVEALELLLGILERAREGFTEAECREGIDFIRNTAPGRFATADAIADEASAMVLDALPLTFTTDNLAAMGELSVPALTEAYRRFVDGQWCVVIVGDAAQIAEPLRALGAGSVTVVPN